MSIEQGNTLTYVNIVLLLWFYRYLNMMEIYILEVHLWFFLKSLFDELERTSIILFLLVIYKHILDQSNLKKVLRIFCTMSTLDKMHLNIGNIEHNMSNIALGVYKFIIKEQHLHSKQTALLTTSGNVKGLSIRVEWKT